MNAETAQRLTIDEPDWLSPVQASDILQLDRQVVMRLAKGGRITTRRVEGTRRIRLLKSDVIRLAEEAIRPAKCHNADG